MTLTDKGTVDREKSSESLLILDPETGKVEFTDPSAILSGEGAIDATEQKQMAAEQIRQEYARRAANQIDGVLPFNQGDTYTINDGSGQLVDVTLVGPAISEDGAQILGQYVVQLPNGQTMIFEGETLQAMADAANLERLNQFEQERQSQRQRQSQAAQAEANRPQYNINDELSLEVDGQIVRGSVSATENEDGLIEVFTEDPIDGKKVNMFTRDELDAMLHEPESEQPLQPLQSEPPMPEGAAQQSATERMPKDERGYPLIDEAEPELTWDYLVENSEGDEEIASEVVADEVASRKKALEEAETALEEIKETKFETEELPEDASVIDKIAAKKAAKKAKEAAIVAAQADVDKAKALLEHWQSIGTIRQRREEAQRQAEEAQRQAEEAEAAELRRQQEAEEREMWLEWFESELPELDKNLDYNEYYGNIADDLQKEIENYGNRQSAASRGESQGDGIHQGSESAGESTIHGNGSEVLSEASSVHTDREGADGIGGKDAAGGAAMDEGGIVPPSALPAESSGGIGGTESDSGQGRQVAQLDNNAESEDIGSSDEARPFTEEEAAEFIQNMESAAVNDPEIELTPQSWIDSFGINNTIETPIGRVKMGNNQYIKLQSKQRASEFGMVVATLQDPDVIFIEPSEAKDGQETERPYSYVFTKTFKRGEDTVKFYTSVTVLKDGLEISTSSHMVGRKSKIREKLTRFKRKYTKQTLIPNSSERRLAEHREDVPDLLPTQGNSVSDGKGNTLSSDKQADGGKSSETPKELTEEDIDRIGADSGIDENVMEGARDWIKGDRTPWAEMCYKTIKDYVGNTGYDSERGGGDADTSQSVGGSSAPAGRGEGQKGSRDSGMDGADGGEDVAGSGESGPDSQGSGGSVSGTRGVDEMGGTESAESADDTDSRVDIRGGRAGGKRSDVRKSGGKRGGKKTSRTDGATASESSAVKKGEETAQGMIDDALATIKDIFKNPGMSRPGQLNDVTTLIAGLGVNAVRFLGATAKLGCGLVMKGYYKYARWNAEMHKNLDPILNEYTDLTDDQIAEYLRSAWDMKMTYRGERKKISEWAAELEVEELRKLAAMSIEEKRKLQAEAEKTEVKVCDIDNIRETLPFLLPAQHEDVEKAEKQFFKSEHSDREHGYGKGYLFTNGTGTGKTYTGLGIAKRFLKQGKKRILIVTVNDTKISDWIKDAKNLGIEAKQLPDTKSKGEGVVVTQYANLRQNHALLEDEFDLIIYDESHKLMENQEGSAGSTAEMHHMIAARDARAVIEREIEVSDLGKTHRELQDAASNLSELSRLMEMPASMLTAKDREKIEQSGYRTKETVDTMLKDVGSEIERIGKEMERLADEAYENETQRARAEEISKKTKTVFLSATPFNTPSSLDYTEGYIFSYPEGKEGTSRKDRRNKFLRDNFGKSHRRNSQGDMTRMSEGQITDPEGVEEEEIKFSNRLQDELHTMSGRMLDSAFDYSRTFPKFDMPEAQLVNAAMSEIIEGPLKEFFKKTLLDYNYSTAFWEIIKTGFSIPRIKEHIALGRKVVVFHRRKASNQDVYCPFAAGIKEAMNSKNQQAKEAATKFAMKSGQPHQNLARQS